MRHLQWASFMSIAFAVLAIGRSVPVSAATCGTCTATTTHVTRTGRSAIILAQDSQSGAYPVSVSASSSIGQSSAASSVGQLHAAISLTAAGSGDITSMSSRATFTDALTFNFGDTAFHTITVPVLADGSVMGADPQNTAFTTSVYATGDFSNGVSGRFQKVFSFVNNVGFSSAGIEGGIPADQTGAFAVSSYLTDHAVDVRYADIISVRSGSSYSFTYRLDVSADWHGVPTVLDLSHTVRAGAFSGNGLLSVQSQSQGLLTEQGGGFGYSGGQGAVPEPTTWTLMLAGFGLIGQALRRQLRRQRLSVSAL